ncbi:hypothetical protein CC1G_08187 [Coprinopsis cinerea okayama7|uniref:F-box domain-containing protein n=1 Tax=Coprinopsis cinerea (strain Okayama-7 / 130 / ATCC MYA-4618 / FGSC 9003) TaxID=240176 RepID=A8P7A5_COPC7|nr:hypothetical protein CC1G_08187 [Coprinopsis cinerea okayama7\|eukprot:XP_001839320.2 hypothetical protein CC1G_08187 [Coprinopsis cinerea okayama7\
MHSPLESLPSELIVRILSAGEHHAIRLLELAMVSDRFRTVITGTPSLWTNIVLFISPENLDVMLAVLDLALICSGPVLLLDLTMEIDLNTTSFQFNQILLRVYEMAPRLRTIEILFDTQANSDMDFVRKLHWMVEDSGQDTPFVNLEKLVLIVGNDRVVDFADYPVSVLFPNLKILSLVGITIRSAHHIPARLALPHLERLDMLVSFDSTSPFILRDLLASVPALRTLVFAMTTDLPSTVTFTHGTREATSPMVHQSLQTLKIQGRLEDLHGQLPTLCLPSLQSLHLSDLYAQLGGAYVAYRGGRLVDNVLEMLAQSKCELKEFAFENCWLKNEDLLRLLLTFQHLTSFTLSLRNVVSLHDDSLFGMLFERSQFERVLPSLRKLVVSTDWISAILEECLEALTLI